MANKKDKPKKITKKEAQADLIGSSTVKSITFFSTEPGFMDETHANVEAVAYVAEGLTQELFLLINGKWKSKGVVKPDRLQAIAHLDKYRWAEKSKADTKTRKGSITEVDRVTLRKAVRFFYDMQKLRIQYGNRDSNQAEPAVLEDDDKTFFGRTSIGLNAMEKDTLKEIEIILHKLPIYTQYLEKQKGIGPTMAAVLIAEIDIAKANTVSALWWYAGLGVVNETGKAARRTRGQKANWNNFLKSKAGFVLATCFIKARSEWTSFYYNYKTRKENQLVETCMLCKGTGKVEHGEDQHEDHRVDDDTAEALAADEKRKKAPPGVCWNCDGSGHNAPWGYGAKHRHQAAMRYMVKMFLASFWAEWRAMEGLPVTPTYAEAKLGMKHGDHAVLPPQHQAG